MQCAWKRMICFCALFCVVSLAAPATSDAANMSVGMGAIGNIFIVEGTPKLGSGYGGHVYFDYRFAPQFSAQFTFAVTSQDGQDLNLGDNGIILFSMPAVSLKYYLLSNSGKIDPYLSLGVGLYMVTEGSRSDGSKSFGFGANAGVGVDAYLTHAISLSLASTFHSIGMIESFGKNNGKGLFPVTATGSIAFHF